MIYQRRLIGHRKENQQCLEFITWRQILLLTLPMLNLTRRGVQQIKARRPPFVLVDLVFPSHHTRLSRQMSV